MELQQGFEFPIAAEVVVVGAHDELIMWRCWLAAPSPEYTTSGD